MRRCAEKNAVIIPFPRSSRSEVCAYSGRIPAILMQVLAFVLVSLQLGQHTVAYANDVEDRHWVRYPRPLGRYENSNWYAIDQTLTLWAIGGNYYFWNGHSFTTPEEYNTSSEVYLGSLGIPAVRSFIGDRKRGLFAVERAYYQPSSRQAGQYSDEMAKNIYYLSADTATYVTTTPEPGVGAHNQLDVTSDGRFLLRGEDRCSIYSSDKWEDVSVNPGPDASLLQTDSGLYLYNDQTIYRFRNGTFEKTLVICDPNTLGEFVGLWADQTLLFSYKERASSGRRGTLQREEEIPADAEISLYDLYSGLKVDFNWDEILPQGYTITEVRDAGEGSFWFLLVDADGKKHLEYVDPHGHAEMLPSVSGFSWNTLFSTDPGNLLKASDGSIWFAASQSGVFQYKNGIIHRHDYRENASCPVYCDSITEGVNGTILVNSGYWLYAFGDGCEEPPRIAEGIPAAHSLDEYHLWDAEIDPSYGIGRVAVLNGSVVAHSTDWSYSRLLLIEPETGRVYLNRSIGERTGIWVMPFPDREDSLLLLAESRFMDVNLTSGAITEFRNFDRDQRLEPILVGQDYVVGHRYRATSMIRLTPSGASAWQTQLPGYILAHPAANGKIVLVQTRKSGYGGQATCAIDIVGGSLLWSDQVDAYGGGTAIDDASEFMVETDSWLSPGMTEGWVIARKPWTGEELWRYVRPASAARHKPILDGETRHTFVVFEDGAVVCLDADEGEVIWETLLPERSFPARNYSYDPYQSCVATVGDSLLAVLDRSGQIHFLSQDSGRVVTRLACPSVAGPDGVWVPSEKIVCPPAFGDDLLVIATKTRIKAYDLNCIISDAIPTN